MMRFIFLTILVLFIVGAMFGGDDEAGVGRTGYVVTEEIALKAVAAKADGLIGSETLLRILNG